MKNIVLSVCLILALAASAGADDVGLVSIKNEFQAGVATGILGHAHARVEQHYLATISSEQAALLTRAGIEFEIVMTDTEPSQTYLVFPPDKPTMERTGIGSETEIGLGLRLAKADEYMSLLPDQRAKAKVRPLDELQIDFQYIPSTISELLSVLEDYPSDTVADLVDPDSVYAFDVRLEDFYTRYIWTDSIDRARDWMVQKFIDWGYTDVTTPEFSYGGGWHYNVMAVKPGYAEPDKVIVIGGHYDSITYGVSPGPTIYAPGADDNASGTVVALELARILADVPLRKTVVFMAFSAEEVGLVGSANAARDFYDAGTDVEVMLNFDMVAHDPLDDRRLDLSSSTVTAYRDITAAAATRLTTVQPRIVSMGSSSDHYSFFQRGYDIVNAIETNFNDDGWHTNLDVSTRLNFPYFTEVVRMAAASIGVIANSAHPTSIEQVIDVGDGHSLEIFWSDCHPDYTYTLWWGTSPGSHPYRIDIPQGDCSYILSGLDEGVTYYFYVIGAVADAYPAPHSVEGSGTSYVIPRAPLSLHAEPDIYEIALDWGDNSEADFSFYQLYRDNGSGMTLYQDNLTQSEFLDTDVEALVEYTYVVTAVDLDMNESANSNSVTALAYTFDQGILLVDETYDDMYLPSQAEQEAYFDSIFAGTQYGLDLVAGTIDTLPRQTAGSYSSIFWFDDDSGNNDIRYSEGTVEWYVGHSVDMFIGGWRTITQWTDSPIDVTHVLYESFGVESYDVNDVNDFAGAFGQDGWPSVTMDTDNLWQGKFPFIAALTPRTGATVIYTFDSFSDNPQFEGQPCGLLYDTPNGIRIVLAFPVYFLTASSSEALITHAKHLLGEAGEYIPGDADGSGQLDALDIAFMVDYCWKSGPAPVNINAADADGSCQVDALDLVYLVEYVFKTGPEPLAGCVY